MQLQLVVDNTEAWKEEFNLLVDDRITLIGIAASPDLNPILLPSVAKALAQIELRLMFLEFKLYKHW